ncbi:MAG: hypothetical protein K0R85_1066 [Devosia sp.]|nr:hypothetical protein [Devosia sp.]
MTANFLRKFCSVVVLLWVGLALAGCGFIKGDNRHNQPLPAATVAALRAMGSSPGDAMMVRIFKQERTLEVWKRTNTGQFALFKSYEICTYSGDLGPKFKEGDRQSPEGFYTVTPGQMNPKSAYYLAFNTGFPNKFDRAMGRTGSNLMVHGDCKSVGCYAMTDGNMAEIYALARESFKGGNPAFQVQIFPFKMNATNLAKQATNQHLPFWKNLKEGYDLFELTKTPPSWDVCEQRYVFNAVTAGPLDPLGPCPVLTSHPTLVAEQQAADAKINDALALIDKQAAEKAAIAARGEAIGGAVTGFFGGVGSVFGAAPAPAQPVVAGEAAPLPQAKPAGV